VREESAADTELRKEREDSMKKGRFVAALILVLGLSGGSLFAQPAGYPSPRGDATIVTSTGTYKLLYPGKLVDATAVRSAVRTLELASVAAAADAKQAEKAVREIRTKIAQNNDAAAKATEDAQRYNAAVKDLKDRQDEHYQQGEVLKQKLNDHNARVRASDSPSSEKRDPATIAALKAEGAELASERSQYVRTESDYNNEAIELNKQKANLVSQGETIDRQATQLDADMASMELKLGEAYRQLQICFDYSKKMKELMARYNVEASSEYKKTITNVSGTLERLKELSDQEFDGNSSGKQPLNPTDVKPPLKITPNSQ
jgi:hypothetical protein